MYKLQVLKVVKETVEGKKHIKKYTGNIAVVLQRFQRSLRYCIRYILERRKDTVKKSKNL